MTASEQHRGVCMSSAVLVCGLCPPHFTQLHAFLTQEAMLSSQTFDCPPPTTTFQGEKERAKKRITVAFSVLGPVIELVRYLRCIFLRHLRASARMYRTRTTLVFESVEALLTQNIRISGLEGRPPICLVLYNNSPIH